MLALSIRQPWAWAILSAGKDVENRVWSTSYRGPIALHAAGAITRDEYAEFRAIYPACGHGDEPPIPWFADLPRGRIVGTADLVDCVTEHGSPWFFGPYGFVLANPRPLVEPIPFKGALGFWRVPAEIVEQIERERLEVVR